MRLYRHYTASGKHGDIKELLIDAERLDWNTQIKDFFKGDVTGIEYQGTIEMRGPSLDMLADIYTEE